MRTDLASGAWIDHRPPGELKGGDRRKLARLRKPNVVVGADGTPDLQSTIGGMDVFAWMDTQQDGCWALLIDAWSYALPVPVIAQDETGDYVVADAESFSELPIDDFDEIEALFAPYQAKLTRRPDPKGTTTSSSNGRSKAKGHSPTG